MKRIIRIRLKAALATTTVAAGIAMSASAEVVSGVEKWAIEPGLIPHIIYNNSGVNFAVQTNSATPWRVDVHHTSGWVYVEKGVAGSTVNVATLLSNLYRAIRLERPAR